MTAVVFLPARGMKEGGAPVIAVAGAGGRGRERGLFSMGEGRRTETAGRLLLSDLVLSFLWTFWNSLLALLINRSLGLEVLNGSLYVLSVIFFSWLGLLTKGGSSNPLVVLSTAMNGDTSMFPGTVAGRILAQVAGSIVGVALTRETLPQLGDGECSNVDIHRGALTEGLITFSYVVIYLGAKRKYPENFVVRASIPAVFRLTLRLLAGGCMNPASAFGWAFARGDYVTKEHLFVYWLAPIEATLLGFWVSSLIVEEGPPHAEEDEKNKSD